MSETSMIVATSPAQMEESQSALIAFCAKKSASISRELATLREELAIAERNHWGTAPIKRRLRREGKRLTFYAKIRSALKAGWYVVPNFMGDAFALRTDQKVPRRERVLRYVGGHDFRQRSRQLAEGEGRYIRPAASYTHEGKIKDGTYQDGSAKMADLYLPADLEDVEFPLEMMRPEIMDATGRAMALKVFDEMLLARDYASCGDPMILGRILNPVRNRPDATFFVAWALPLDRW